MQSEIDRLTSLNLSLEKAVKELEEKSCSSNTYCLSCCDTNISKKKEVSSFENDQLSTPKAIANGVLNFSSQKVLILGGSSSIIPFFAKYCQSSESITIVAPEIPEKIYQTGNFTWNKQSVEEYSKSDLMENSVCYVDTSSVPLNQVENITKIFMKDKNNVLLSDTKHHPSSSISNFGQQFQIITKNCVDRNYSDITTEDTTIITPS